jgi:hypothetical protein
MTPDLIGEAVVDLMVLAGFMVVLGIGALIADYVFPHIPFIQRYLDSLPDYEDDEELYQQEMARVRRKRIAHRNRRNAR